MSETTNDWSADTYRRFERERSRPASELLARVPPGARRRVVDLGCGPGNSTALLVARFPGAQIIGLDTSPDMLSAARTRLPGVAFHQGDIAAFEDPLAELIFANAAMHWVRDHLAVMGRLVAALPPRGCLAAQMPDNENEPTHRLMREIAALPRFRDKLAGVGATRDRIGGFADYDDALSPFCDEIDIWRTTYALRLDGPDAIVAWVEGAGLRPFVAPLDVAERSEFLALYRGGIARAYPPRAGGGALLPFPRLFIVATRRDKD